MSTTRNLAAVAAIALRGLRGGWRLALLEHYLQIPGVHRRVRRLLAGSGRHLLVACMPKSGSTFLAAVLTEASGYRPRTLMYGGAQNEQDLYLPDLVRWYREDTVTQQHMRASDPNVKLIEAFALTPIVLVRNLSDVVVSLYDHLHREAIRASMAYVTEEFFRLEPRKQIDYVIDLFMPWYVSFYVSWRSAEQARCPVSWVRYEEMIRAPVATIRALLARVGIERDESALAGAIERAKQGFVRINKGVAGRGATFLDAAQRERIAALTRHYPSIDFSPVL